MNYIGDFLALAIVAILLIFFLEKKPLLSTPSKLYIAALSLTAITTVTDLVAIYLLSHEGISVILNLHVNNLYFFFNILTTSTFALYLFSKILEHVYDKHCYRRGFIMLFTLLAAYTVIILLNIPFGWLFYFDENGVYHRGPVNYLGYVVTLIQVVLVLICYFKNKKYATLMLRTALTQIIPSIIVAIVIQRLNTHIMMNGMIMAFVALVLFLSFQGQKPGVSNITKLNDRQRFFNDVSSRIKKREQFQIIHISLKNYSIINQKFGYKKGDEILYRFAFALESINRSASAYHMNGTVFALIYSYKTEEEAEINRELIIDFLNKGVDFNGEKVKDEYVVVEYCIDSCLERGDNFYEKMEYTASIAEKLAVSYIKYTPEYGERMLRERYLISRLENVSEEEGYEVWYQPVMSLSEGCFNTAEALIRLREKDGSIISPGEFIPLAEQTGRINKITLFVAKQVSAFLREYPELNLTISLNLPMAQLIEQHFYDEFVKIMNESQIPHERVCLEFTERAILDDFEQTKLAMEKMTREGFLFYLDDFGTGYSNFNCLLRLPFKCIKLDRSITSGTTDDSDRIVSSLTDLFHDMDHVVIAEGAETKEDVDRLLSCGVDRIQGYYYSKPMPKTELVHFLKSKS